MNSWILLSTLVSILFVSDFRNRLACKPVVILLLLPVFIKSNAMWIRNMCAVFAWAFAECVANTLNTSEIIYFEPIFIECRCNKIVLVASFCGWFSTFSVLSLCRLRNAYIMCIVHSLRLAPLISTTVFLFICQNDDLVAFALQNEQRKISAPTVCADWHSLRCEFWMGWCAVNWNCMLSSPVWMWPVFLVAPTVIQWQNSYTHVLCTDCRIGFA